MTISNESTGLVAGARPGGAGASGLPALRLLLNDWQRRSTANRRLFSIGLGLMVLTIVALALMVWELHRNALIDTRKTVGALGTAISEQTSRSMQGADIVLQDMQRQIAELRLDTVAQFKAALGNETLFRSMKDRADILPQVNAFTIIAADGKLVNFSRQWPAPPTDLSDRDYFRHFQASDTQEAFVSAPVQNRGDGVWTSYLVRRINSPSGVFLGMVLVAVDLDYFRDFFRAVTEQAGTTVMLLRRDGTLLTGYPMTARIGEVVPASSPWHAVVRGKAGEIETKNMLVPGSAIVGVHALEDYPLVVDVSVSRSVALATWLRTSVIIGFASVFTIGCFMLLMREQLIQFGKLERSEHLLGSRNEALEATDRTLRMQAQELSAGRTAMAEQSATLQAALRHMNQGIIMVDAADRLVVCNERAAAMLEIPAEFLAERHSFGDLVTFQDSIGEFVDSASQARRHSAAEVVSGPEVYERTRPNGSILEIQTQPMAGGGFVRTYTDVTERRRTERQVAFLARHDPVTGLFNRTAFKEQFETLIAEAAEARQQLGVFYIDLDGFKLINDTHGHAIGDALLIKVAQRLKATIRDTDTVARMGGDEFAVVQPFTGTVGNVGDLATRMLASVAEPYWIGNTRCSVSLSIGVALYPEHAKDPALLLHNADTALYRAKASGKARFCVFDPATDGGAHAPLSLEHDLSQALAKEQLYLDYQPIVDATTLAVVRYEALLRWRHPTRGQVPTSDFVPVAETSGLVVPIGLWVLETACGAARGWPDGVGLSVNLSPRQFASGDLVDQVEQILGRTGLDAHRLNLEITEGVLLEQTSRVVDTMSRLHGMGIRFSLDDFGTAHAGLTYLRAFTFDVLKIDKSFVQDAAKSPEARDLLFAIGAIGRACQLQVVAEGVETEAELALVRELACDHVQGYLLGRPGPVRSEGA